MLNRTIYARRELKWKSLKAKRRLRRMDIKMISMIIVVMILIMNSYSLHLKSIMEENP